MDKWIAVDWGTSFFRAYLIKDEKVLCAAKTNDGLKFVQNKNNRGWFVLAPAIFFVQLPIISVILGSFRVRDVSENSNSFKWSTEGWYEAFQGSYSFPPLSEALFNSLIYFVHFQKFVIY